MTNCCISTPKLRENHKERERTVFAKHKCTNRPKYNLSAFPIESTTATGIAIRWSYIAQEKFEQAINPSDKAQFSNIFSICQSIIRHKEDHGEGEEAYVCTDDVGNQQAIMILSKNINILHIDYLVTHPHNIRSKENENEEFKVEGAGTHLLKKAEDRARELGCSEIYVKPTSSSTLFYLLNGYSEHENSMIKTVRKVTSTISPIFSIKSLAENTSPLSDS